jgi:hypothetical protein
LLQHNENYRKKSLVDRQFFVGIFAAGISLLTTILLQIVSVPLFLKIGGPELLGQWILLVSFFSVISLVDLGYFESISAAMTFHALSSNHNRAQSLLDAGFAMIVSLIGIGFFVSTIYIYAAEQPLSYKIKLCFASLTFVFTLSQRLSLACFRSQNNFGMGLFLNYTVSIIYPIGVLLTAWVSHSIESILVAVGLIQLMSTFFIYKVTERQTGLRVNWFGFDKIKTLAELKHTAIGNVAMPAAIAIWNSGFIFFIAQTLGPSAAVVFNTTRVLFRIPVQLHSIINASLSIKIGQMEIAKNFNGASKLLYLGFFIAILLFASGFLILFYGSEIYSLWTKSQLPLDKKLGLCFIFDSGAAILWFFIFSILNSRRKAMICGIGALSSAALSLALLYFQKFMGLEVSLIEIVLWHLFANISTLVIALIELKRTSPSAIFPQLQE